MANITLRQWAENIKQPVGRLIELMEKAGLPNRSADDTVSKEEQLRLVQSLKTNKPITRRRKTASQIKTQSKVAGAGTVSVEVRSTKTLGEKKAVKKKTAATVVASADAPTPATAVTSPRMSKPAAETLASVPAESAKKTLRPMVEPPLPAAPPSGERRELKVAQDKRGKRKARKKRIRPEKVVQPKRQEFEKPTAPVKRDIEIPDTISVGDLAQRMAVKSGELIKQMLDMGMMATINQTLDQDTATLIVEELGHTAKLVSGTNVEQALLADEPGGGGAVVPRPPVVTVMGHVDHGKTSLLDYIRKSQIADSEAGGITQHIGAYHVDTERGTVTFLDTPGHAAFTSMRARGANATDIVVLVVAADDGVMPQTEEAIEHARAAQVPIVVAVNKTDKEEADPEKIRSDLAQQEVVPEGWGGQNIFIDVSAKTGQGVDNLLEAILLQAEVLELKAAVDTPAGGIVIESMLDKGRGPVATVLVRQGRLKCGDIVLAGQEFGRVRAMLDENGNTLESAGPSIPAVVLGLSGAPAAGEEVRVMSSERKAREIAEFRNKKVREGKFAAQSAPITGENFFESMEEKSPESLNVLIKADVQGSAEALKEALSALSGEEIQNKIISSGIGGINESDVALAAAANGVIIGFNVRADAQARKIAQAEGVQIRYYNVIYEAIDDVRQIMSGMLEPEVRERIVGIAEVKDVFRSSRMGAVAGCQVVEGSVRRGSPIRVLRDNVVIYEGGLESLRRHKDDVNEVAAGTECGIAVKNYNDVKPGDSIEVYEQVKVQREL